MKKPPDGENLSPTTSFPDFCFMILLILLHEYWLVSFILPYF